MSDDDVKILFPKFGDPKITIDRSAPRCDHKFVTLVVKDKTVRCRLCRETVSAFDVLFDVTREWDWATHFGEQQDARQAAIEELKKEEQLLKGKIRRGRASAPESKSALFFAELMRRLESVTDNQQKWDVERWRNGFQWLEPQQIAVVLEALVRMDRRIEDHQRKAGRSRRVKVLKGGKDG